MQGGTFLVLAISTLMTSVMSFSGQEGDYLSANWTGNAIAFSYGGKVRLSDGHPLAGKHDLSVRSVIPGVPACLLHTASGDVRVEVAARVHSQVATLFLTADSLVPGATEYVGMFFGEIPDFSQGVAIWRYKPWNSWSKPMPIKSVSQLEEWDTQFFYWRYSDGVYGAAFPLSGRGFRTTIGNAGGMFGAKSVSYCAGTRISRVPQMVVGFGKDPYELFDRLFDEGLTQIGRAEDLLSNKTFPRILEKIGWCSWNASDMGKNLSESFLLDVAGSFRRAHFPLGWILIDDGWFDHTESMLNSFRPDTAKFPHGFAHLVSTMKLKYSIHDVGVWHALNGYWHGINPRSQLGDKYVNDLVYWEEKARPDLPGSGTIRCAFLSPESRALNDFYHDLHQSLRRSGISFIKVDNQLAVERMSPGNFPIQEGAEQYHAALNRSVASTFDTTMINCMDMTPDAYLNFGNSAVARAEDDYAPYHEREGYNLNGGNAAAHVLQAIYNSLYFSHMVFADFDQFESYNPNAAFHAIARALNNGPVYVTDEAGKQRFDVLLPLVYGDGRVVKSSTALLPTEDCLFQVQSPAPFKAFSFAGVPDSGSSGLIGIWNCADTDHVDGSWAPSDVHGLRGEQFAVYEYFSRELRIAGRDERLPIHLGRLGYKLYSVVPLVNGNGVIGLVDKYNAPASVLSSMISKKEIIATVYEGGRFAAVVSGRPAGVSVAGRTIPYTLKDALLLVTLPKAGSGGAVKVRISF
jgi:hypothetical protein